MSDGQEVALDVATPRDAGVLSNLLELYVHDLSETFALELGADGRFGYDKLPLYWSEPERRFPFLIHLGSRVVGFALVTRKSPASDDPGDFDVTEFFVLRRHRRAGIGRRAAFLLWNRFPVHWIVRVSAGNHDARRFWASVIAEYAGGAQRETTRPGSPHAWHVFSFDGGDRRAVGDVRRDTTAMPGAAFDQVNLVVRDMDATLSFYRRLGLTIQTPPSWPPGSAARHAEVGMPGGVRLEFDNHEMAKIWHAGWAQSSEGSRAVLGFALGSREEVDERYAELTAAGYVGRQPPYDAFWGSRYAIVRDPDGNDVGLMSPSDPAKRFIPQA